MNNKKNNGITLISLVITIVIMLILAAVTINLILGNNGILNRTKKAAQINCQKDVEEQIELMMSEYTMDNVNDSKDFDTFLDEKKNSNDIQNYTNKEDGTYIIRKDDYDVTIKKDDLNIVNSTKIDTHIESRDGLEVGDYVDYNPTTANDIVYDKLTLDNTGSSKNSLAITKENLKWQILKIHEDGKIDLIGSVTNQYAIFKGSKGYNNAVYLLNDLCATLYSTDTIKARSVNMDDIEAWLTDAGNNVKNNYKSEYGKKIGETLNYGEHPFPSLYKYETGSGLTPNGINQSASTPSGYTMPTSDTETNGNLTVTQTYWYTGRDGLNSTNFGDGAKVLNSAKSYQVATRWVTCDKLYTYPVYASFGLYMADTSVHDEFLYYSNGYNGYNDIGENELGVRPVVTIDGNVKINVSDNATNSSTPHIIEVKQ